MRQIFTSQRLENVETVAQLLREAGIEVRISDGRSYKGNRRRTFSYRPEANSAPQPAVWVTRSEDQPRARELVRTYGLTDIRTTRPTASDSYLPPTRAPGMGMLGGGERQKPPASQQKIARYRRMLLVLIAILAALVMVSWM